ERGAGGDVLEERVREDVPQSLAQLLAHARRRVVAWRRLLVLADAEDEEGGADEADGVEGDRGRCPERVDDDAGEARAAELRRGATDLEFRVAVDQLSALDERREVRLVRDVEEDGRDADEEADAVELPDRQVAEPVGDRDRTE